jgi:hypothetical protein
VLLHLAFPERYPILDVRALHALGVRGHFAMSYKRWLEYVEAYREFIQIAGVDGRTWDRGIWQWSVEQDERLH